MQRIGNKTRPLRRGTSLGWAVTFLVVVFAFTAFTIDVGFMAMVKGELQNAADAAALGGVTQLANGEAAVIGEAQRVSAANRVAETPCVLATTDVEVGNFDLGTKVFTPSLGNANAVKVTARRSNQDLFLAGIMGSKNFSSQAEAIAIVHPRDIVFVVDLSGSMNDDTEPLWATDAIASMVSGTSYPTVGNDLMQDVFDDFGYGTFPGRTAFLGSALGVASNEYAYAEMTKDDGPLTAGSLAAQYRITNSDSEAVRKEKAYRWLIDNQIATQMPLARPTPSSTTNYTYWANYLDYIIDRERIGTEPTPIDDGGGDGEDPTDPIEPSPPTIGMLMNNRGLFNVADPTEPAQEVPTPGTPRRGSSAEWVLLPPNINQNRHHKFNNPSAAYPSAQETWPWQNRIGYITYVQFMMDFGRERSPDINNATNADPTLGTKSPLSILSPDCPRRTESTAGGNFSFPPRSQPMHSVRRALIAGIALIQDLNSGVTPGYGDRVSIVTFDGNDAYHQSQVALSLTSDFNAAMRACTDLQASADIGATTATETGLILARNHVKTKTTGNNNANDPVGPQGRRSAKKVIVLLTDGLPNAWESSDGVIDSYLNMTPSPNNYPDGYNWLNSVLMQASQFQADKGTLFPVGMGLGTDYDFMDRLSRVSVTDRSGLSPRGTGNPAEYENVLINTLSEIIKNPGGRLAK